MEGFFYSSLFVYPAVGASAFLVSYLWADRIVEALRYRSLGQREEVMRLMRLMYIETDETRVTRLMLIMSFGPGALIFLALWPSVWSGLFFGGIFVVAGWSVPKTIVQSLWERRCGVIVDQMVDGMTIMSNGVKSGLSPQQAMERVAENLANPIAQEFQTVLQEIRLGSSLQDALNKLGMRVPRPDVQMFVTSINILQETGGNMAETFQTINYTIRERQKIEKKIDALTAQARTQGLIISMVPFVLLLVMGIADPAMVKPLFTTIPGVIALLMVLALQTIGGMMIRRIAKIQV